MFSQRHPKHYVLSVVDYDEQYEVVTGSSWGGLGCSCSVQLYYCIGYMRSTAIHGTALVCDFESVHRNWKIVRNIYG